ncbi:MAG: DinB family protein [Candidatus Rokubacteria bacterium]|nr:DinB family protein [Candidatus Rokubacteria bacterium]
MALDRMDREKMIQQYADGPARLRAALATVPPDAMQWRPKPGEWSAHEVICHCADSETNSYARIRFLVAENAPTIVGYDQEHWARVFDYHTLPLEPALATVDAVRGSTAALIRRLPDAAWQRTGTHTESGHYSAEDWLRIYADHLEVHARQIEANVAAWRAEAPSR